MVTKLLVLTQVIFLLLNGTLSHSSHTRRGHTAKKTVSRNVKRSGVMPGVVPAWAVGRNNNMSGSSANRRTVHIPARYIRTGRGPPIVASVSLATGVPSAAFSSFPNPSPFISVAKPQKKTMIDILSNADVAHSNEEESFVFDTTNDFHSDFFPEKLPDQSKGDLQASARVPSQPNNAIQGNSVSKGQPNNVVRIPALARRNNPSATNIPKNSNGKQFSRTPGDDKYTGYEDVDEENFDNEDDTGTGGSSQLGNVTNTTQTDNGGEDAGYVYDDVEDDDGTEGEQDRSDEEDQDDADEGVNDSRSPNSGSLIIMPGGKVESDPAGNEKRGWRIITINRGQGGTGANAGGWAYMLRRWDWRRFISGFAYESVSRANIGFLVDGSFTRHMWMIQRLVYNLILMFRRGSQAAVASFGANVHLTTGFRTFRSVTEIKTACESIHADPGRRIGEALQYFYNLINQAKQTNKRPTVLFLLVRGANAGNAALLARLKRMYKLVGIKIYILAFGSRINMNELVQITRQERIFQVANYEAVISGGKGLVVGGVNKQASMFAILQRRVGKWIGTSGGIDSVHSLHHHGHGHKEFWFLYWGWSKYINIHYGSFGKANVAFVIDGSNAELITFLQHFVYNYIRLFQLQGTYFTIMVFGRDQYRVASWVSFVSPQEIQKTCASIPFIQTKTRNTARALKEMYRLFDHQKSTNSNPNILFLLITGSATDKNNLAEVGQMFKSIKVKVMGIGVGKQAQRLSTELNQVSYSSQYVKTGSVSSLTNARYFEQITSMLKKEIGEGSTINVNKGNSMYLKIQAKWDWSSEYRELKYGFLGRANVGILIDGVSVNDFGYIRRLVYNILRMYSLSGTYVTITIYGSKVYRVTNFCQLPGPKDIKKIMTSMPKVANGKRMTGKAIMFMINAFSKAPPCNPSVIYLITQGSSSDDMKKAASYARSYGIKMFAFGIGDQVSGKELSQVAFSSSLVFMGQKNAIVPTLKQCQDASARVVGTVTPACGRYGHTSLKSSDVVKNWEWKTYGVNFAYYAVSRTSVAFLIDASNKHHFDVLQKLVYNLVKLFAQGTSVSIVTYGGEVDDSLAMFRTFEDTTAFQTACQSIAYKGSDGRKTGQALTKMSSVFERSTGGDKKLLFLLVTGKSDDDVVAPAKSLVVKGISIFALGVGQSVDASEIKMISRYYLTTKWRGLLMSMVKVQNSLIKVVGKNQDEEKETGAQPETPISEPKNKPPLPPPSMSYITSATSVSLATLQTMWDWTKLVGGLQPGSLKAANIIILIDITKPESFDILLRMVFNTLVMFRIDQSMISIMTYGGDVNPVATLKPFSSIKELKQLLTTIKASASSSCRLGKALNFVKTNVIAASAQDEKKKIMFVFTRSKSKDDITRGSEQLKGAQVTTCAIGIGDDVSYEEINVLASTGQMAVSGAFSEAAIMLTRVAFSVTMIANGVPNTRSISLQSMAYSSSTFMASIMGSIQTGSIATENAGAQGGAAGAQGGVAASQGGTQGGVQSGGQGVGQGSGQGVGQGGGQGVGQGSVQGAGQGGGQGVGQSSGQGVGQGGGQGVGQGSGQGVGQGGGQGVGQGSGQGVGQGSGQGVGQGGGQGVGQGSGQGVGQGGGQGVGQGGGQGVGQGIAVGNLQGTTGAGPNGAGAVRVQDQQSGKNGPAVGQGPGIGGTPGGGIGGVEGGGNVGGQIEGGNAESGPGGTIGGAGSTSVGVGGTKGAEGGGSNGVEGATGGQEPGGSAGATGDLGGAIDESVGATGGGTAGNGAGTEGELEGAVGGNGAGGGTEGNTAAGQGAEVGVGGNVEGPQGADRNSAANDAVGAAGGTGGGAPGNGGVGVGIGVGNGGGGASQAAEGGGVGAGAGGPGGEGAVGEGINGATGGVNGAVGTAGPADGATVSANGAAGVPVGSTGDDAGRPAGGDVGRPAGGAGGGPVGGAVSGPAGGAAGEPAGGAASKPAVGATGRPAGGPVGGTSGGEPGGGDETMGRPYGSEGGVGGGEVAGPGAAAVGVNGPNTQVGTDKPGGGGAGQVLGGANGNEGTGGGVLEGGGGGPEGGVTGAGGGGAEGAIGAGGKGGTMGGNNSGGGGMGGSFGGGTSDSGQYSTSSGYRVSGGGTSHSGKWGYNSQRISGGGGFGGGQGFRISGSWRFKNGGGRKQFNSNQGTGNGDLTDNGSELGTNDSGEPLNQEGNMDQRDSRHGDSGLGDDLDGNSESVPSPGKNDGGYENGANKDISQVLSDTMDDNGGNKQGGNGVDAGDGGGGGEDDCLVAKKKKRSKKCQVLKYSDDKMKEFIAPIKYIKSNTQSIEGLETKNEEDAGYEGLEASEDVDLNTIQNLLEDFYGDNLKKRTLQNRKGVLQNNKKLDAQASRKVIATDATLKAHSKLT